MSDIKSDIQNTFNEMMIISKALQDLKQESISLNNIKSERFGILFLGEKFNTINSAELREVLARHYNLDLPHEALLVAIPQLCKHNNMQIRALKNLQNLNKLDEEPSIYQIELF
ncbi:hypothetical protein NST39_16340 [Bacillus sp. FSL W8-0645]|uniref:hypothetical protein n=1 Tax=Bacillus sp. FSL W8-0645 TaxID=2954627 RepID=UPI0030F8CD70